MVNLRNIISAIASTDQPVSVSTTPARPSRTTAWAIVSLIIAGPVVCALFTWVMFVVLYGKWPLKLEVVLKRLDITGNAVIGLLTLLGIIVVAIVVGAIGAKVSAGVGAANISIAPEGDMTQAAQVTTTTTVETPTKQGE